MESSNRDRENRLYASLHCREKFASKVNSIAKKASSELFPILGPLAHDSFQKSFESFLNSNPSNGSAGKRTERCGWGLPPCRMTLCPSLTAPSLFAAIGFKSTFYFLTKNKNEVSLRDNPISILFFM
jgi:hypothetical protein